jgi:hypothetical protein
MLVYLGKYLSLLVVWGVIKRCRVFLIFMSLSRIPLHTIYYVNGIAPIVTPLQEHGYKQLLVFLWNRDAIKLYKTV